MRDKYAEKLVVVCEIQSVLTSSIVSDELVKIIPAVATQWLLKRHLEYSIILATNKNIYIIPGTIPENTLKNYRINIIKIPNVAYYATRAKCKSGTKNRWINMGLLEWIIQINSTKLFELQI